MEKREEKFTFRDRELDWLRFNARVLQEAEDHTNPIMERLKFLAIFSSNLDEFFRVRVSKLRQIKKVKKSVRKPLGLKPNKMLKKLLKIIDSDQQRFGEIFNLKIKPELNRHGIVLKRLGEYTNSEMRSMEDIFVKRIQHLLHITYEKNISSDVLENGALYLLGINNNDQLFAINVPTREAGRFIRLPEVNGKHTYAYIEDIIKLNIPKISENLGCYDVYNIKISRDAELYLDDEYEGEWVDTIYNSLKKPQIAQPTRLLYESGMPKHVRKLLRNVLKLGKVDMFEGGERHNFSDFFNFPVTDTNNDHYFEELPPLAHNAFDRTSNMFRAIKKKDRMVHFPYQRFDYVERWLTEAARDKNVISIQISLYRIAEESKLTSALLEAIENGKAVMIFVEAKARFDEANNIEWGKRFEKKGAKVFYSFPNVKVHSKIIYVERLEYNNPRGYAYIGTGNFNAKTAKIYGDHGLFTADRTITSDLSKVFSVLQREMLKPKFKELLVSPYSTRNGFINLVRREIAHAVQGKATLIRLKMNSLEDKQMIKWLYRASNAGVTIELMIRGFCCLIPEVPGQSEHIRVYSIIDRYLEHARLFYFQNDGQEELYMGSADWMTRNLDKRVEVITPVKDDELFRVLKNILELQFSDNRKRRIIKSANNNEFVSSEPGSRKIRSQFAIYDYLKSLQD
ncbi:MAG: polyphosphate kinase 1 [Maribacter sp.]